MPFHLRTVFSHVLRQCSLPLPTTPELVLTTPSLSSSAVIIIRGLTRLIRQFTDQPRSPFDSMAAHRYFFQRDLAAYQQQQQHSSSSSSSSRDAYFAFLDARLAACFEPIHRLWDKGTVPPPPPPPPPLFTRVLQTAVLEAIVVALHALRSCIDDDDLEGPPLAVILDHLVRACEPHAIGLLRLVPPNSFEDCMEMRMAATAGSLELVP